MGLSSDTFSEMYSDDIDDGDYDDLCCDNSAGFYKGTSNANCYNTSFSAATWTAAQTACAGMGAHLVNFIDAAEQTAVFSQMDWNGATSGLGSPTVGNTWWIGVTDAVTERSPKCDSTSGGCESSFTDWASSHGN